MIKFNLFIVSILLISLVSASTNITDKSIDMTGNVTTTSWFNGLFNWFIDLPSQIYLSFNGTTLNFNESKFNETIDIRISMNNSVNYTNIVLNNQTNNINITTNKWFNGLFNWTISSISSSWLQFTGAVLSFNETRLNNTIGQYVSNITNQSLWVRNGNSLSPSYYGDNINMSGGNITLNEGWIKLNKNATIGRDGVNTTVWISETGNLITKFG